MLLTGICVVVPRWAGNGAGGVYRKVQRVVRPTQRVCKTRGLVGSSYQISPRQDETLLRYSDLIVFKMAAFRHIGFIEI